MEASVGRIVHYQVAPGRCQAAVIVRTWSPSTANLQIFRDGSNDDRYDQGQSWRTSITEGAGPTHYHDPRECTVSQE